MKLICIIDDDAVHRKLVEHNLTSQGYQTRSFSSGAAFMSEKLSEPPFAIILDHFLSEEKTGLEYLTEIKSKMPKVPVIYMTNENSEKLIRSIMERKAAGYIAKDVASLVRLRTILDQLAEQKKESWLTRIFK